MNSELSKSFFKEAWEIYTNSECVDDYFRKLIESLAKIIGANVILLYLEDDSVLTGITKDNQVINAQPIFTPQFILVSTYPRSTSFKASTSIDVQKLKLTKRVKIGGSVHFHSVSASSLGLSFQGIASTDKLLVFDSPKVTLCRGLFAIHIPALTISDINIFRLLIGQWLDFVIPSVEAVYRRQLDRLERMVFSSGDKYYTGNPGYFFQQNYREVCESLGVEGASLIVKGLPSSASSLQLVSTYPKALPQDRNVYSRDSFSPTQWVFDFEKSCIIPDIMRLRADLVTAHSHGGKIPERPIWSDPTDVNKNRCVAFNFYKGQDEMNYLFRVTESKKNPSNLLHILDRKIGQELVVCLALMHKSIENEFRAMRVFVSVKHEFRQKLVGLNSATNYVLKSLQRQSHNEVTMHERMKKLDHIKNTVADIVKMLNRFNFPLPSIQQELDQITPFKPYADLVRSVCETFLDKARSKKLYFTYHGHDQLGLVYSNLSEWKQVVENIVNNMVKYTNNNEELAIAFARTPSGGGEIHFASRSITINPAEIDQIFEFRYRSKAAFEKTSDGDGIGLSIAKFIVTGHGGQIQVRIKGDVNIFTICMPRHLFRPAEYQTISEA